MSEKKPKHYVNNADFLKALVDYKERCAEAKKAEKDDPQITWAVLKNLSSVIESYVEAMQDELELV